MTTLEKLFPVGKIKSIQGSNMIDMPPPLGPIFPGHTRKKLGLQILLKKLDRATQISNRRTGLVFLMKYAAGIYDASFTSAGKSVFHFTVFVKIF
jgi:hypothetical protein